MRNLLMRTPQVFIKIMDDRSIAAIHQQAHTSQMRCREPN